MLLTWIFYRQYKIKVRLLFCWWVVPFMIRQPDICFFHPTWVLVPRALSNALKCTSTCKWNYLEDIILYWSDGITCCIVFLLWLYTLFCTAVQYVQLTLFYRCKIYSENQICTNCTMIFFLSTFWRILCCSHWIQ